MIVAYAAILGLVTRNLNWQGIRQAVAETVRLTSAIFMIIAASAVVSWLLAFGQVPSQFSVLLEPFADSPTLTLLLLSLITFVTGMLMEEVSALMLLTPVFVPVAMQAGVDPVHLGIVITMNITIALITPPMGACVFVAAAVSKVELSMMFRSIWPFVLVAMCTLVLLILMPQLTLFLPNLLE